MHTGPDFGSQIRENVFSDILEESGGLLEMLVRGPDAFLGGPVYPGTPQRL